MEPGHETAKNIKCGNDRSGYNQEQILYPVARGLRVFGQRWMKNEKPEQWHDAPKQQPYCFGQTEKQIQKFSGLFRSVVFSARLYSMTCVWLFSYHKSRTGSIAKQRGPN